MIAAMFAAAIVLAQAAPDAATAAAPPASTPHGVSGVTITGETAKKRAAPDPKEVVCHKEKVMGSLFPKEICARREDIADRQRVDQKTVRDSQALRPWKDPAGD
jgi:hypothetical protein